MEISEGFLNLEKKTHLTHNLKTSLILTKDIINSVLFTNKLIYHLEIIKINL